MHRLVNFDPFINWIGELQRLVLHTMHNPHMVKYMGRMRSCICRQQILKQRKASVDLLVCSFELVIDTVSMTAAFNADCMPHWE